MPAPQASRVGVVAAVSLALISCAGLAIGAAFLRKPAKVAMAVERTKPAAVAPVQGAPPVSSCPEGMVLIPSGKFFMGSDDKGDFAFERPAHQVVLGEFCIDRYEVTVERYQACSDRGDCKRAGMVNDWEGITPAEHEAFDPLCNARDAEGKANHPVNCVDWGMADAFCRAGIPRGRLPREAEWEHATRGSDGRKFPWGDDPPDAKRLNACDRDCVAWGKKNHVEETSMFEASDGYANTAPVGSFPLGNSPFGLADVVGNVWEWTADWYDAYDDAAETDPKGPAVEVSGNGRVIRGGAWNGQHPAWVRPTFRYHDAPSKRSYGIGFRCAADVTSP